jgi:hypothetical protein
MNKIIKSSLSFRERLERFMLVEKKINQLLILTTFATAIVGEARNKTYKDPLDLNMRDNN